MTFLNTTFLTLLLLFFSGCSNQPEKKMTVATASSMKRVADELIKTFTEKTNNKCELIIGASGNITSQIKQGAPYDLFLSADMAYPKFLWDEGMTKKPPKIYAYGKLVIWSSIEGIKPDISTFMSDSITHVAIANPRLAPYGKVTMQYLENQGVLNEVEKKLVFGESITQTNQFIYSQSAEIGITALSTLVNNNQVGDAQWRAIDEKFYDQVEQGVVVIKKGVDDNLVADSFKDFLFSEEGQSILTQYGYSLPQ